MPSEGYDELQFARTTVENHYEWAGCATGDLRTQTDPCSLFPATAALNSQQCFFASVNEPSQAPERLTYSSGHVCTNPPCQFIPAVTFPHGNLIYSLSALTHPSPADSINSSVQTLCDKGKMSGWGLDLLWAQLQGFHGLSFCNGFFTGIGEILGQQRLSLWTPTIPPGAAELIWPNT